MIKQNQSLTITKQRTLKTYAYFTIVYSTVYSCKDQRKHESSASLAFVRGIHRWPVNSPHKWPVTGKLFPFDDVSMRWMCCVAPPAITSTRNAGLLSGENMCLAGLLFHKYKPLYLHSFIATHPTNSVQVNFAIKFSENLHIAYSCSVYFYEGRLFFPWLVQKSWLCLLLQDVHSFVLSMFCVS